RRSPHYQETAVIGLNRTHQFQGAGNRLLANRDAGDKVPEEVTNNRVNTARNYAPSCCTPSRPLDSQFRL
ncbi:hypothetical protein LEMLEM_LOCUS24078, partial [Lemmus lemmus]